MASLVHLLQPRLPVFMACHDIYSRRSAVRDRDKHLQALAENNFQLFAGVQGFSTLFFKFYAVKRWWDTSQLALTGVVKDF